VSQSHATVSTPRRSNLHDRKLPRPFANAVFFRRKIRLLVKEVEGGTGTLANPYIARLSHLRGSWSRKPQCQAP